jgi:CheY-like chemotaxis protein
MTGDRILIVDDNSANQKLLSFLLKTHGYEIRVADSAERALVVLESFVPRMILMDIQLPGMDGLALTRTLRAAPLLRDTVIIAVTAYAMKGDEEKALQAGCDGYITKPIDTRALPVTVANYLAGTGSQEEP